MKEQDEVSKIASTHLGKKQGDYTEELKPGDPDILVPIPRALNRKSLQVFHSDTNPFSKIEGSDIWWGYEVSALTNSGYPVNFIAQIEVPVSSRNIIESKSMKLYWNSFHQLRCGDTPQDVEKYLRKTSASHLTAAADFPNGGVVFPRVTVALHPANTFTPTVYDTNGWVDVDAKYNDTVRYLPENSVFTDNPEVLDVSGYKTLKIRTTALRSNCRVTGQPDFGDVFIYMKGENLPSEISLLRYIVSFRQECHFHEEIVEALYSELCMRYKPNHLSISAYYTRRGGWAIVPHRTYLCASYNCFNQTSPRQ